MEISLKKLILSYFIKPSQEDTLRFINETSLHSISYEYYSKALGYGQEELKSMGSGNSERPHDISGQYNKFKWMIINGLARQYQIDPYNIKHNLFVVPSVKLHQNQNHHRLWIKNSGTLDEMRAEAIDVCLVYRGNREYNGGRYDFKDILEKMLGDCPHEFQKPHLEYVFERFVDVEEPNLSWFNLNNQFIPLLNLANQVHNQIFVNVRGVLRMLKNKGYDLENINL